MTGPILIINYEYPPVGAGAANATYHIAKALVLRGKKVHVVTSSYGSFRGCTVEHDIHIHRIRSIRRKPEQSSLTEMLIFVISAALHLPSILKQVNPCGCIIFFAFPCGPLGLYAQLYRRIPYIISLRGGDVPGAEKKLAVIHWLLTPLRREIYKRSKATVANSEGLRTLSLKSDPKTEVLIIPNGVDLDFFSPAPHLCKEDKPYTFMFAGRFTTQKNVTAILKACRICIENNHLFRIVLSGGGPLHESLIKEASLLNICSFLEWKPWCDKDTLRSLYRSVDCFINPSLYEGMANTVLEAMACGLPVLAGNCPGNSDLIIDGKNGFLFEPDSVDTLATLMSWMIANQDSGKNMGNSGREMCEQRYSWDLAAQRYEGCFGVV